MLLFPGVAQPAAKQLIELVLSVGEHLSKLYDFYSQSKCRPLSVGFEPLRALYLQSDISKQSFDQVVKMFQTFVLNCGVKVQPVYLSGILELLQANVQSIVQDEDVFIRLQTCLSFHDKIIEKERLNRQHWTAHAQYCLEFVIGLLSPDLQLEVQKIIGYYF